MQIYEAGSDNACLLRAPVIIRRKAEIGKCPNSPKITEIA